MPGFTFFIMALENKRSAIVFVDGNNWYHNVKSIVRKPRGLDFEKIGKLVWILAR